MIFYHTEEQRRAALKSYRIAADLGVYRSPIVTQLVPMRAFYRAEDYHQDYYGGKPRASAAADNIQSQEIACFHWKDGFAHRQTVRH